MVVFLLSAMSAYLLLAPAGARPVSEPTTVWRRRWPVSAALLVALGLFLYALESGPQDGAFVHFLRRVVTAPDTLHALLGAVAGIMCRAFPWPPAAAPQASETKDATEGGLGKWRLLVGAAGLAAIAMAALLVPYASGIYDRIAGVETPYLKVQFATSQAEKQAVLKAERDLVSFDKLDDFPQSLRFIQYDCGQAALENGGMAKFVTAKLANKPQYADFTNAYSFRNNFNTYVNYLISAQREHTADILKPRARLLADKFAHLVSDPTHQDFADRYHLVLSEIMRQIDLLKNEGGKPEPTAQEQERRKADPDPPWCRRADDKYIGAPEALRLVQHTRYLYGVAAGLFDFAGNNEGVLWMMSLAKTMATLDRDINVNLALASALYLGGRDFRDILPLVDIYRQSIAENKRSVDRFVEDPNGDVATDRSIRDALHRRYARADFGAKLRLAYLWAQKGLSSQEDGAFDSDVPWESANRIVEEAYNTLTRGGPPRFPCTDDARDLYIKDIYAYVKLAIQAHNVQAYRMQPDQGEIRRALEVLRSARAEVSDKQRKLLDAKLSSKPAQTCIIESETKAWLKRIGAHIRLGEAMLRS